MARDGLGLQSNARQRLSKLPTASGVISDPADPAMRGARGPRGPKILVRIFFTLQFACTLGFGHRDKEEEGPIGFLGGGAKFEVTPLPTAA